LNQSKYIVNLWNREGSASSGNGIVEFTKQTINRLSGKIKISGVVADTGYYKIDFVKYLESMDLPYIIGVPLYQTLQSRIVLIKEWKAVSQGIAISEFNFIHKDEKWDQDRRYIVVRQEIDKLKEPKGKQLKLFKEDELLSKYKYGCYITSSNDEAENIWQQYRLRADDENRIKENKMDFALEGFSLDGFYATETAMLLRIL